jgi:hypothetical protein
VPWCQVISDPSYGLGEPIALSSDGTGAWVANLEYNPVTGIPVSSG